MTINNYSFNLDDFLYDVNGYRLFEVEVEESMGKNKGKKIYKIKPIELSKNDTAERIQSIIKKLEEGKIWLKIGKRKEDKKYAGKGLGYLSENPGQIEKIVIQKPELTVEITENLSAKVEEIDAEKKSILKSLLEKIKETQQNRLKPNLRQQQIIKGDSSPAA